MPSPHPPSQTSALRASSHRKRRSSPDSVTAHTRFAAGENWSPATLDSRTQIADADKPAPQWARGPRPEHERRSCLDPNFGVQTSLQRQYVTNRNANLHAPGKGGLRGDPAADNHRVQGSCSEVLSLLHARDFASAHRNHRVSGIAVRARTRQRRAIAKRSLDASVAWGSRCDPRPSLPTHSTATSTVSSCYT